MHLKLRKAVLPVLFDGGAGETEDSRKIRSRHALRGQVDDFQLAGGELPAQLVIPGQFQLQARQSQKQCAGSAARLFLQCAYLSCSEELRTAFIEELPYILDISGENSVLYGLNR